MQDFNELTKGAKTYEGYITLHEKDQHLYAEIKPMLLEQPILAPMVIARGSANAGQPLNFGDEWVLSFHRIGDNFLQLVRKNIHFTAPVRASPLEKALKQNYTDSILMSLPILSISPRGGAKVVDFADIFLGYFAQVGFGSLDRSRSRGFQDPRLSRQRRDPGGGDVQRRQVRHVPVRRRRVGGGRPARDHHGPALQPLQGPGPRLSLEDGRLPRVGHFLNTVTDFANADPDTNAKRMINRWRLEKANPSAKLSPPKKQIVWYIEDNVPVEYRPYVQEGILEWNKAFEKIGFKDAIAVRWQNERDDFDPEDIHYCTLRWITTGRTLRDVGAAQQPLDRRDDRRGRDLRHRLDQTMEGRVRDPGWACRCRRPRARSPTGRWTRSPWRWARS